MKTETPVNGKINQTMVALATAIREAASNRDWDTVIRLRQMREDLAQIKLQTRESQIENAESFM